MDLNRKALLCAFALGLLACVNARTLTQTGASCAAAGFIEIVVTDGVCEGEAEITCEAAAESESAFKIAIQEWFAEDYKYLCQEERRDAAAIAIGKAIAKLLARAFVKVSCTGSGSACGWGFSQGSAWAVATAKAIAIAAVDLGPDRAICEADVTALSGAFVDVAGKAQAGACQKGPGSESEYERLFLESIRFPVADAFAWATAEYCNFGFEVIAKSKCKGRAGSSVTTGGDTVDGSGDGTAEGGKLPACSGAGDAKCCPGSFRFSNCNCQDCNGPWARLQDYDAGQRTWEDQQGNACFCAEP